MPDHAIIDDGSGFSTLYEQDEDIDVYTIQDGDIDESFYDELDSYTAVLVGDDLDDELRTAIDDSPAVTLDQETAIRAAADAVYEELEQAPYRQQAKELQETIDGRDSWAILLHDNPDPDAMSAALAFNELADADIYHRGEINHQQNKVMVNQLEDLDLTRVKDGDGMPELDDYDGIALLDTNPYSTSIFGDGDDQYDIDETFIDVIIDHHENWQDKEFYEDTENGFIDLRTERGSTASLMTDYLELLDVDYDNDTATALLVGIMADTDDLNPKRNFSQEDIDAIPSLYSKAKDRENLASIWDPPISEDFLDVWAEGIKNREKDESVVYSYLGEVDEPNAISGAAEILLKLEAIDTSLAYGLEEADNGTEQIRISGRNNNAKINLGEAIQQRFERGGGSLDSAGAQIPIDEDHFQGIADKYYEAEEDGRKQVYLDAILESIKQDLEDLDKETS
ncbi:MAG: DHH family phosphoesterase [Candidatus Nanohaloarchaea archaeon]|nr:DHH family phosphoesterase [Candidatus Nanohaloarchaea archaeon]